MRLTVTGNSIFTDSMTVIGAYWAGRSPRAADTSVLTTPAITFKSFLHAGIIRLFVGR
jgi:hypothetical protein